MLAMASKHGFSHRAALLAHFQSVSDADERQIHTAFRQAVRDLKDGLVDTAGLEQAVLRKL